MLHGTIQATAVTACPHSALQQHVPARALRGNLVLVVACTTSGAGGTGSERLAKLLRLQVPERVEVVRHELELDL